MMPTNADLRQFILSFFSDEELETLCFDYFREVQQNFTSGMTKNRKVILLIGYCDTRGRMDDLIAALERERPSTWLEKFGAPHISTTDTIVTPPALPWYKRIRREWASSSRSQSTDFLPGKQSLSSDRIIHEKTDIEFVLVPAGTFLFGDSNTTMELPAYWIGRYPVTNAQYKRFLDANPAYPVPFRDNDWAKPYNWDRKMRAYPAGKADHPVVLVSWNDAQAFCDWAGLRLPAEQEWEKAARGNKDGRIYPWADEWLDGRCNTSEAGVGGTSRVGQYSPQSNSPYGCADMAGNVWEWTASWYDQKQGRRVLRGGSWNDDQRTARVSFRTFSYSPAVANHYFGFRPVAPVDSGY